MQRNLNAVGKVRHHPRFIQRNDADLRVRKIFGQKAAPRTERVVSVGNRQLDRFDSDFQHVTRLSSFDKDRPGQNVSARSFVGDFSVDVAQRLLDVRGLHPRAFQTRWARSDQRLHFNRITRLDAQYRRRAGIVITPRDRLGCRFELIGCGLLGLRGKSKQQHYGQ